MSAITMQQMAEQEREQAAARQTIARLNAELKAAQKRNGELTEIERKYNALAAAWLMRDAADSQDAEHPPHCCCARCQ